MSDEAERKKAETLERLARVPEKCDKLEGVAREILGASQEARESAKLDSVLVNALPTDTPGAEEDLRDVSKIWEEFDYSADALLSGFEGVLPITVITSGTTAQATISLAVTIRAAQLSPEDREIVERAQEEHWRRHDVDQLVELVRQDMARLQLNHAGTGLKPPAEWLDEAHLAIRYPVAAHAGWSSVLLALRSTIDRSIEELLRRAPVQEKTKNRPEKILSIGRYSAKKGLPPDYFEHFISEDKALNAELSAGKRDAVDPRDVTRAFQKVAIFLRALLSAVDERRLKQP